MHHLPFSTAHQFERRFEMMLFKRGNSRGTLPD